MRVLTLDQIDALTPNDAFVIVDGDFTMDGGQRVAYLMPDYATAVTYTTLVRRFLAAEQEDEPDMAAAHVVCAARKHYALTQYPALFGHLEIGKTSELDMRIEVGIANWQQTAWKAKDTLRRMPPRQLELTEAPRPCPQVPAEVTVE